MKKPKQAKKTEVTQAEPRVQLPAAPLTEAQAVIAMIERAARDQSVDVMKLKELLAMKNAEQDRDWDPAWTEAAARLRGPQAHQRARQRDCGEQPTESAVEAPERDVVTPNARHAEEEYCAGACNDAIGDFASNRWPLHRPAAPDCGRKPRNGPGQPEIPRRVEGRHISGHPFEGSEGKTLSGRVGQDLLDACDPSSTTFQQFDRFGDSIGAGIRCRAQAIGY